MKTVALLMITAAVLCLAAPVPNLSAFQSPHLTPPATPTPVSTPTQTSPTAALSQRAANFQFWVSVARDVVYILAAVITVPVAVVGLRKWRAELAGRAKLDIARKMVTLARNFRDQFLWARGLYIEPGEAAGRPRTEAESSEQAQILDEYYAKSQRVAPLMKTFRELRALGWEAEAVSGDNIEAMLRPLEEALEELRISCLVWFNWKLADAISTRKHGPSEEMQAREQIVYGSKDDSLSQSVSSAVDALVKKLRDWSG